MLDNLARRLLEPVNTSVISILGLFNLLFGIWLLLPFDSIVLSSPYLSEWGIGAITTLIGILILIGSIFERLFPLSTGTLIGFCFWIAVTGVVLLTRWQSPGWIFALMIALYCLFVNLNIRINSNLLNKLK